MSRRLPALNSKDLLRVLKRAGFEVHQVTGNHYILKRGTLRSIIEQAGYTTDEFAELL